MESKFVRYDNAGEDEDIEGRRLTEVNLMLNAFVFYRKHLENRQAFEANSPYCRWSGSLAARKAQSDKIAMLDSMIENLEQLEPYLEQTTDPTVA